MTKYLCECGELIRTSGAIPNPIEWLLISDVEYDTLHGEIDSESLLQRMTSLYRCPACDSLWIFWDGHGGPPKIYRPALSDD